MVLGALEAQVAFGLRRFQNEMHCVFRRDGSSLDATLPPIC